jgi:small GTP-binding protein
VSIHQKAKFPERISSLIMKKHLEKPIEKYERNDLANLTSKAIIGIGNRFAAKLKRKAGIETIADLVKLDYQNAEDIGISQKLLEKWTLSASIIFRYSSGVEVPLSSRRICIAGLGAVGKSSLLKTLQKQRTIAIKFPTMGATVEHLQFLGLQIAVWDLGGQIGFRHLYLTEPRQYLSRIMLLIYVIDTQDKERAGKSAEYLEELLIKLEYLKEKPKIYLVLHKYDPSSDQNVLDSSANSILAFMTPILIKRGFVDFRVLRTSIFDVEGLVKIFSKIFTDISPLSQILTDSLAFYSESHGFKASFLITENGFIAAEWTELLTNKQRESVFLEIMEGIRKETYESKEKHERLTLMSQQGGVFLSIDRIEFNTIKLFLCSVSPELKSLDDPKRLRLHEEIHPWIINFFSIIT